MCVCVCGGGGGEGVCRVSGLSAPESVNYTEITPENVQTGLQSLDGGRGYKLLDQAVKFKRLQDHPVRQRLYQQTEGRLKRRSFIHQSRILERR